MRKKNAKAAKLGRKGGKARWAGVSPEARRQAMREVLAQRWAKQRTP